MGAAARLAQETLADGVSVQRITNLRDRFEAGLREPIPGMVVHGSGGRRVPNTSFVLFPGIESSSLLPVLAAGGVEVSAGSACNAGSSAPSPVLLAMGCTPDEAACSIRFSLSSQTNQEEIDRALEVTGDAVKLLSELGS